MGRLVIAIFVGLIVSSCGIESRVAGFDENIESSEVLTQLFESAGRGNADAQYSLGEM